MKTRLSKPIRTMAIFVAALVSSNAAQVDAPSVIERGPHHRVVRNTQTIQVGDRFVQRNSDIVELESGMHRWNGRAWVDASPKLRVVNGKAVANLFYSVEFAANLASRGAVSVTLPDGNRLTMHVLGLAYVDGPNSVMIAEVKDCAAEIGGPEGNEITYRDAFTDFPIDCKFTIRKGSLSQHIWIRSALPPPTDYGLSEKAFLEVFTEFVEHPQGTIEPRRWRPATAERAEIMDEKISFGSLEFITGKAFFSEHGVLDGEVPVSKTWSVLEGRTFLRERIPFHDLKAEIQKLPAAARAARPHRNVKLLAAGFLPPRRESRPPIKDIQMAAVQLPDSKAYIVDWETAVSADLFTWTAAATHYIVGAITVKTNVFEGTVIKLAPTNNAKLTITGPVTNYASQYRPVTFTARDDHNIGEVIGTDVINGYYGTKALELDWYTSGTLFNLEHFRFRYAQVGVHFNGGLGNVLSHAQFVNCSNAIEQTSSDVSLRNALIHRANNAFVGNSGSTNRGEHLTLHEIVNHHTSGNPVLFLTNSLLVAITNAGTYSGLSNQTATAVGSGFQTAGAGNHYLTNASVWRDAGTTNINTNLLAYLAQSTTFPPVVYSNEVFSTATTFTPQAARDTTVPDLGCHLPPLDYFVRSLIVSNCVLTVTNGVSIGTFGLTGILLRRNSELTVKGLATDLVHLAPAFAVQEQPVAWGLPALGQSHVMLFSHWETTAPKLQLRFTASDIPAGTLSYHILTSSDGNRGFTNVAVKDCQFSGGSLWFDALPGKNAFTNNVFERMQIVMLDTFEFVFANNNLRGVRGLFFQINSNGFWHFKDNLVDSSSADYSAPCQREYNAFYQSTNFYAWQNTNATEMVLTNLVYETGRFGPWYQPANSPVLNAGSANDAATVGFYWYTTTTNNAIEGNSRLDIGYHSVALNSSTQPWDTNEDGTPNYTEDLDGDGLTDPNELTGLKIWLRADAGVTNDVSDRVSGWADQSGNNNHAAQTTAANKPLYVANVLNGKSVIRFDGSAYYFNLVNFLSGLSQGEIFVVLRASNDVPSTSKSLWKMGSSASVYYPSSEGSIWEDFGSSTLRQGWDPFQPLNQYHTYNVSAKVGQWISRLNGIIFFSATNNSTVSFASAPTLAKNSTSYFHGDVAELFCYNKVLSTADRDALGAYLNSRYAIVTSAPSAPSTLTALALSPTQISVAWLATLGNQKLNFKVERKTGAGGAYSQIAFLENSCSFIDTNLTPSTEYYYRVKASNYAGDSAYSSETNAITLATGSDLPLANLKVWYKADAGRGATNIGQWHDQSGSGNHASQLTQNKMPIVSPNTQNGRPVLKFDGSNDQFDLPNFLQGFTEAEAYVVLKADADVPASSKGLWKFGNASSTYYPQNPNGHVWDDFFSTSTKQTGNPTQSLDQFHVLNVSSKAYDWALIINGLVHYSTNVNTIHTNTSPKLGLGAFNFAGELAELMFFNRVLTNSERDVVGNYLNQKYLFITNAPNTPAGLLVSALSSNELSLTWTNVSSVLGLSYHLDRKISSGGTWAELARVWNSTSYLDAATVPSTDYIYRVRGRNYYGYSAYGSEFAPPTTLITNPVFGSIFTLGASPTISAALADSDGSVTQAVFYADLISLGTDIAAPFSLTWNSPLQGSYRLWVKAWDDAGNTRISRFHDAWISLDTDGDGVNDFLEIAQGTNPAATDTDGDGVGDGTDVFPLDPNRSSLPGADGTPPVITLEEPAEATPIP